MVNINSIEEIESLIYKRTKPLKEEICKLRFELEELKEALTIPDVVNHVCPDPTHHAMDIGLMDKCSTCGATE